MTTWIGFLRAINLGRTRKFAKSDIIAATELAGGTDVRTYINTGNVRFDHPSSDRAEVEGALEDAYRTQSGFEVPTICFTPAELRRVAEDAAELGHPTVHYVAMLKQEPDPDAVAIIEGASTDTERALVRGRAVHLLLGDNYHQARLNNATVEKAFGVATTRNNTVIRTLAERWC